MGHGLNAASSSLRGRVVLVTGGSRGIGRAIVDEALARGARVAYCTRREPGTDSAAATISEGGQEQPLALQADVSLEEDVERLFDRTEAAFGHVDVVINNAAIEHASLLVNLAASDWDRLVAVNTTGAFLVCRRAIRHFLARGIGGRIINVGSISQEGAPANAGYAASKAALLGLTRFVAARYAADRISATLVAPGFVDTALTASLPQHDRDSLVRHCPLKRAAAPEEVARAVLHFAHCRGADRRGASLRATGGLLETPL